MLQSCAMWNWLQSFSVESLKILAPVLLTALVGNRLLQRWQQRSWLQQQAVLQSHKEIDEVKSTIDEFIKLADARSYRARRLVRNLPRATEARIDSLRNEYDLSVAAWNDRLNSFQVRLTIYAKYRFAQRIENSIQPRFAELSEAIERLLSLPPDVRGQEACRAMSIFEDNLNSLNGILFAFSRDVMRYLIDEQRMMYLGRPIQFSESTLESFSTWYLFKELFKTEHPPQTIFSTPVNSSLPDVIRS
ncbi:hypothetical protein BH09VER1_BH09VER1_54980 [soil metagenome]